MITLVPLKETHLEDAAELFTLNYQSLRQKVPALPQKYLNREAIIPLLQDQLTRSTGVAALNGSVLAGYMLGMQIPNFNGPGNGVYCPEWGHSAAEADKAEIYNQMYNRLSAVWAADGCFTQAISFLAHQKSALSAFYWLGFGLLVIDAIRPLEPVTQADPPDVEIKRAGPDDAAAVICLAEQLNRHVAAAPIFLACAEPADPASLADELAIGKKKIRLAYTAGKPVAYIQTEPASFGAAQIVNAPEVIAITGAFTAPEYRGAGIGLALLNDLLAETAQNGAESCSVDFESANSLAGRFWLKHFSPVCYSAIRRLNPEIIPANHRFNLYRREITGDFS